MSGALEVAAVGDRITHAFSLPDAKSLLATAVSLGQKAFSKKGGKDAVCAALVGKAVTELGGRALDAIGDKPRCPNPSGAIEDGSPDTFVGPAARPVALADQAKVSCRRHKDKPIRQGSASVWVNSRPLARRTDETKCGARIGEGEPTVFAGKDTQDCMPAEGTLPAWLKSGIGAVVEIVSHKGKLDLVAAVEIGASLAGLGTGDLDRAAAALEGAVEGVEELGVKLGKKVEGLFDDAVGAVRDAKLGQALADGCADAVFSVLGAFGLR
ncbi:MAG: PAAR domain-containing protein [Myxococcales bacterium]|nr:PAAR domain-containing protein [Myxococcales bacterium]